MSLELIIRLKERDGLKCGICGKSLTAEWTEYLKWKNRVPGRKRRLAIDLTIDHIKPKSVIREQNNIREKKAFRGNLANLQLAHKVCNEIKGNTY